MREHFSTDAVPPRDRAQFGLDLLAEKIARLTPDGRPELAVFRAELDVSIVGQFTTFHFETSHLNWRRTPADLRVCSSDKFSLLRAPSERAYVAGPMRSTNVEIRLGAGDFCISSNMWPYQSAEKESFSVGGLLIPHGVLSPLLAGGQLTRPVPVPSRSPLGSVLGAAFDAAITQVPALSPGLGDAVLQNLCFGLWRLGGGAVERAGVAARCPI